jgi:hypothetical protein
LDGIRVAADCVSAAGGRSTLAISEHVPPWPPNQLSDRLYGLWRSAGDSLGMNVTPQARGGLSDGNFFWHRFPTLDGLGPTGGHFHCSERSADGEKQPEYVLRLSFVPKALLNAKAILALLRSARGDSPSGAEGLR